MNTRRSSPTLSHSLPVAAPEHLAVIWQTDRGGQAVIELTHRHLREWMASGSTFTHASLVGSHNWNADGQSSRRSTASRDVILRGVLVRAAWRVGAGTALGVVFALGAGRALQGLLYGVAPADAATYAIALVLLIAATAIAAFIPARRIGQLEPQVLIRQDQAGLP